jgi:thymidylate kinase
VDGPRIAELSDRRGGLLAALRRREEAIYARIPSPDLVILLTIEPAVALERKRNAKPDAIAAKARAVLDAAGRASGDGVVAIDASRPLAEVVRTVEAEIWQRL